MTTGRLDAFELRDDVIKTYADYVTSFIKISDDRVADKVRESLDAGDLWPEPWVQISFSYKVEATTDDLIAAGTFDPAIRPSVSTPAGDPWQFSTPRSRPSAVPPRVGEFQQPVRGDRP